MVVAAMGDLLGGLKGMLVNFVVRKVKKMVPAFSLPGSLRFNDAVAQGAGMTLKPVARTPDDVAFLQYTGGTTGVSKGATLQNRNVIANMLQVEAWMQPAINTHTDTQHNFVCALPLYHIFALTVCNMIGMRTGSCNLLIPNPRDIPGFVKELSTFKFNVFPCLNTLFNALANNRIRQAGFLELKIAAAARCSRPSDKWLNHRRPIIEGYGLSRPRRWPPQPRDSRSSPPPSACPALDRYPILDDNGVSGAGRAGEIAIRAAGDGGLLAAPGRNRQGDDTGWLLQDRRCGRHG